MARELLRGRLVLWGTAFAAAAIVGLPTFRPALGSMSGLLVGPGVGAALFVALGGRPRLPSARPAAVFVRAGYLLVAAGFEELLWRGVALALLVTRLHPVGALAATSAGFALAHRHSQGRRAAVQLVTGLGFGSAFLAAGLAAAIAAHAVYNLFVDLAVLAARAPR